MNHSELIKIGMTWLGSRMNCAVIKAEACSSNQERPDVWGVRANGLSVVIECKTSNEGLSHDLQKPFRNDPGCGLGALRYYLLTDDLDESLCAEGWGILKVGKNGKVKALRDSEKFPLTDYRHQAEMRLMLTLLKEKFTDKTVKIQRRNLGRRGKSGKRKNPFRVVTRVQLVGRAVIERMQAAQLDTAGLAERLGRNPRSVRLTLAMLDRRTVNEGTALGLARALGCEVKDLKKQDQVQVQVQVQDQV